MTEPSHFYWGKIDITRGRKVLIPELLLGEQCVYVYKIPIEKLFGLEGKMPPNQAPPIKDEC